ncbi:DUF2591 family protein [Enterobacter sp. Z1]|uniref:phage protein NinX family protein n=1 Tax=Enterobacter sp. Z1 TaxID=2561927 RepID=UPI0011E05163|nr:phage protein NinX family protein [Enterobacter sp. Z1]TYD05517.1 DUF2591 domain-containing protein [Enterobacter sp. Z1]USX30384.1 DUF2591 family protein [Enterobacter sp. Z1]
MDYSQLSDFEINKLVAQAKRYPIKSTQHFGDAGLSIVMCEYGYPAHFDPCRNPGDAWPIIEKQLIRIVPVVIGEKTQWVCSRDIHASASENPLRAAMIVFIMMQDAKHA